jgi:hypothetical protein
LKASRELTTICQVLSAVIVAVQKRRKAFTGWNAELNDKPGRMARWMVPNCTNSKILINPVKTQIIFGKCPINATGNNINAKEPIT